MPRPPHARLAVLQAAEAIVKELGAAHLTFDEIVRRSGITRGGVTYHFPTKEALLTALVEQDLQGWRDCIAAKRALRSGRLERVAGTVAGSEHDALVAYLESGCEPDADASRLCAGLLSATMAQKTLSRPWREFFAEHLAHARASSDPPLAMLLMLATDGLFWLETLGLSTLGAAERRALVGRIVGLAEGLAMPAPPPRTAPAASRKATPTRTRSAAGSPRPGRTKP